MSDYNNDDIMSSDSLLPKPSSSDTSSPDATPALFNKGASGSNGMPKWLNLSSSSPNKPFDSNVPSPSGDTGLAKLLPLSSFDKKSSSTVNNMGPSPETKQMVFDLAKNLQQDTENLNIAIKNGDVEKTNLLNTKINKDIVTKNFIMSRELNLKEMPKPPILEHTQQKLGSLFNVMVGLMTIMSGIGKGKRGRAATYALSGMYDAFRENDQVEWKRQLENYKNEITSIKNENDLAIKKYESIMAKALAGQKIDEDILKMETEKINIPIDTLKAIKDSSEKLLKDGMELEKITSADSYREIEALYKAKNFELNSMNVSSEIKHRSVMEAQGQERINISKEKEAAKAESKSSSSSGDSTEVMKKMSPALKLAMDMWKKEVSLGKTTDDFYTWAKVHAPKVLKEYQDLTGFVPKKEEKPTTKQPEESFWDKINPFSKKDNSSELARKKIKQEMDSLN